MKTVIYCRVASPEQPDTQLALQEQRAREYAAQQGHEIVGVIKECQNGLSMMNRPGIQEIYAMAGRGEMDMVLTKSLCRFTRETFKPDLGNFLDAMEGMGITVATLDDGIISNRIVKIPRGVERFLARRHRRSGAECLLALLDVIVANPKSKRAAKKLLKNKRND